MFAPSSVPLLWLIRKIAIQRLSFRVLLRSRPVRPYGVVADADYREVTCQYIVCRKEELSEDS